MSLQLLHMNRAAGLVDSSLELPATPPPSDPMSSVAATRINMFWSCSLIMSLLTASFGIFIKQWVHAYMSLENRSPIIQLRIRFFRDDGLATFKVWEIAAILPILLQIAFFLFLIGFAEFILQTNPTVGWIAIAMMIVWLAAIVLTTIIPLFSSQCPYKSPLWVTIVRQIRWAFWGISEYTSVISVNWLEVSKDAKQQEKALKKSQSQETPPETGEVPPGTTHQSPDVEGLAGTSSAQLSSSTASAPGWMHRVRYWLWQIISPFGHWFNDHLARYRRYLEFLIGHFEENVIRTASSSDIAILARAQNLLLDQELADHIRRCAEAISLLEANDYMKARLRLSPFKSHCEAMKSANTWSSLSKSNSAPKWYAAFPRKADHLLYEILSYAFDKRIMENTFVVNGLGMDLERTGLESLQTPISRFGLLAGAPRPNPPTEDPSSRPIVADNVGEAGSVVSRQVPDDERKNISRPASSTSRAKSILDPNKESTRSDHESDAGAQAHTPKPGSMSQVASMTDERKTKLNPVDNSSSVVIKRYAESLGPFWRFKMVYESLTYVLFFACHSKMTHSSSIWRALQGDVMYFSWISQSFPLAAIQLIQSQSPIAGVCVFMSLYGVITALRDKIEEVHNKLIEETKEFGKRQRKAQKGQETPVKTPDGVGNAPRQDVRFGSEIPGKDEQPQQQPDNRVAGKEFATEIPGKERPQRHADNQVADKELVSEIPGKAERPQQHADNQVAGKECELQLPRLQSLD